MLLTESHMGASIYDVRVVGRGETVLSMQTSCKNLANISQTEAPWQDVRFGAEVHHQNLGGERERNKDKERGESERGRRTYNNFD